MNGNMLERMKRELNEREKQVKALPLTSVVFVGAVLLLARFFSGSGYVFAMFWTGGLFVCVFLIYAAKLKSDIRENRKRIADHEKYEDEM
jgi:hypothetical protein